MGTTPEKQVMLFSWWRSAKRGTSSHLRKLGRCLPRGTLVPRLELLEDRTLPSTGIAVPPVLAESSPLAITAEPTAPGLDHAADSSPGQGALYGPVSHSMVTRSMHPRQSSFSGPAYPPPRGASFSATGNGIGRAGGKTNNYSQFNFTAFGELVWEPYTPQLSLNATPPSPPS